MATMAHLSLTYLQMRVQGKDQKNSYQATSRCCYGWLGNYWGGGEGQQHVHTECGEPLAHVGYGLLFVIPISPNRKYRVYAVIVLMPPVS